MRRIAAGFVTLLLATAACATGTATIEAPSTVAPTTSQPAPVATTVTTTPPTTAIDWEQVAAEYAAEITDGMPHGGAIVAIWRDGTLYEAAAGEQPDGTPIPVGSTWRIGSVTKPFVASVVLRLVDEGLLVLDEPAATYLPEPTVPDTVSVRDLLGHTSGIFNYTDDIGFLPTAFTDLEKVWDPTAIVAHALTLREVEPNPAWSYSNTNYLILGLIVEEVTGQTIVDRLEEIYALAGLDATYLAGAETGPAPPGAFTYFPGQPVPVDADFPYTSTASGAWTAGAMVSDAADLTAFFRTLMSGGIVSANSLDAMTAVGEEGYGLGLVRLGSVRSEVFGHDGGITGFVSRAAYAPAEDVAVIIGITSDNPPSRLPQILQSLLVAALAG